MNKKNKDEINFFNLNYENQLYISNIYQDFIQEEESIPIYWREFFNSMNKTLFIDDKLCDDSYNILTKNDHLFFNQVKFFFRTYGHKYANVNPLKFKDYNTEIYQSFQLNSQILFDIQDNNLINFYEKYKNIYCQSIGFEYIHIDNIKERIWIQDYIENQFNNFNLLNEKKLQLLNQLIESEVFEKFLHTKYPGYKRFSLEGSEILIPILKNIIQYASHQQSDKIIIGMAHRGRLNVLINILKKNIHELCYEFSEKYENYFGTGDAKYHAGMKSIIKINNHNICIDLKSNPSHLEIINPVVMGSSRVYIDELNNQDSNMIIPINIHGDSAIIGQGVNQELLNMSKTNNYTVGGTIHLVVNNNIGFTTSEKKETRSSRYCTDIAKIIQSPILHINADHPESAIFAIKLALDFRYKFKKDVFIDIVCYRRHGHNESDEPSVTQPILYQKIKKHPTVSQVYFEYLNKKKIIHYNDFKKIKLYYRHKFDFLSQKPFQFLKDNYFNKNKINKHQFKKVNLYELFKKINIIPKNINIHHRVSKIYHARQQIIQKNNFIDWSSAESLAYAYILNQGISCRLSGEDVARGTFFHRHAVIYDQKTESKYVPLNNICQDQGKFYICNSVLSEEAVLAFEYGYSIDSNKIINIWEAQYGDFINGAQIVIDQFISSGEQKWNISSKLIILLPHGYEGQGPEHSSCRLERFLQLCAQNNLIICIPSTPAQIYHLIINQTFNNQRKPLIILTPKSLLRNSISYSPFQDLENRNFLPVIDENNNTNKQLVNKVIFCSGKIYYELLYERNKIKNHNIILIRIEKLYPFPTHEILKIFNKYHNKNIFWCQEEPKNQGAWFYMYYQFKKILPSINLHYIGRSTSAAPSVGCLYIHKKQQKRIIYTALDMIE